MVLVLGQQCWVIVVGWALGHREFGHLWPSQVASEFVLELVSMIALRACVAIVFGFCFHIGIFVGGCVCVYMCVCVSVCLSVWLAVWLFVCLCVCVCVCVCV